MRTMIILRGPKGSGRTEYIQRLGLTPWAVDQRLVANIIAEPVQDMQRDFIADPRHRGSVRARTLNILEEKLRRGALVFFIPSDTGTPLSAAQVSVSDRIILEVAERARRRRYNVLVLDFARGETVDSIERRRSAIVSMVYEPPSCAARDLSYFARPAARSEMTSAGCKILSQIPQTVDALMDEVPAPNFDISACRAVVAIGDIHGHSQALNALLDDRPRPDTAYILTGDYINKGPSSAEVLRRLNDHFADHEHTIMLAGNHERGLEEWSLGNAVHQDIFNATTLPDLTASCFTKAEAGDFVARLHDAAWITWRKTKILATHGGFDRPPVHMQLLSGDHLQFGVGNSSFDIDQAWEDHVLNGTLPDPQRLIQVHGHRNKSKKPIAAGVGSFNLEGIDNGPRLRALILSADSEQGYRAQSLETPLCDQIAEGCA
jgi:predicted phosphodiesterase/predicted ATPase